MKFKEKGKKVVLHGVIDEVKINLIRGNKVEKWRRKNGYGIIAQLEAVSKLLRENELLPKDMKQLVEEFGDSSAEPTVLLQPKSHDHYIPLKEGAKPFQLRPFRCPCV